MAPFLKIPSPNPFRSLTVAAIAALAISIAVPAGTAGGQEQGIDRGVIPVAPDAPSSYVVQTGDTLWDISAKFLTDPWYWPEIWHINPQVANPHLIYPGDTLALTWVEGQPRVTLASSGSTRLSPRVRTNPLTEAVRAIPYERAAVFMTRPTVLSAEQVKGAPYVAYGRDDRLISAVGNDIYVRRLSNSKVGNRYSIYHVADELKDPDDGDVIGYQGIFTGEADVKRLSDPSTLLVVDSVRETLEGDILLPLVGEPRTDFFPRAPKTKVDGQIMSVSDERTVVTESDVIVINRGTRHGLEPGHVLEIWQAGEQVRDTTDHAVSRTMETPEVRIGLFMVFKTFDRLSYGLALQSEREIYVGDMVRSP